MYYPQQRFIARLARIQREALLPEDAIGSVQVNEGDRVDIRDRVARGLIPARHIILDAMSELRLRNPQQLEELMLVPLNRPVAEGAAIAGKNPERGRRVLAPMQGIVVHVDTDNGRIIMQEMPQIIDLEAGVQGVVRRVYPERGVSIEATGAVVQGVWGNGQNAIATINIAPDRGIANMSRDSLESAYRNEIVITNRPLTAAEIEVGRVRRFAGIIAPSMRAALLSRAIDAPYAILLTEGFGEMKMPGVAFSLFETYAGRQGTLDAYLPRRFEPRRPEVVINRPPADEDEAAQMKQRESQNRPLRVGMRVRITREPYLSLTGTVDALPNQPLMLDNGLRAKCARVELLAGEFVDVPLANLELVGG